jgi:TonB-linked SusC/RagA family outer membrane protein
MSSVFRRILVGAAALAIAAPAWAQSTGTIAGRVIDRQTERPLASVQVRIVGTTRGAQTDETGSYRIVGVPAGVVQIAAQRIGYGPQSRTVTVEAGGVTTADVQMTVAVTTLDQVIVTATGREQTTREIGSSVGALNTADVQMAPITSASELLQGKISGVVVTPSSGTTGGGSRVRIRGNNSMSLSNAPLIIIDGARVENSEASLGFGVGGQAPSRLNDLNPEDIETIEILKGPAAAALYGTAAANGVVQVTTKRGASGRPEFRVWSEQGSLKQKSEFPSNVYSTGTLVVRNTAGAVVAAPASVGSRCDIIRQAIGANPTGTQVGCTAVTNTYTRNPLEDPLTSPFRSGNRQSLGGSVSGGADAATFYLSSDYDKEQGITPLNGLQRLKLQANSTGRIGQKLSVGANISYLNNRTDLPNGDNALFGIVPMGLFGSANPATPAINQGFQNDPAFFYDWITSQNYARMNGSIRGEYHPISWLSFNGNAGLDRYAREDRNRVPRRSAYGPAFGDVYTNGWIQSYTYDIYDLTTNGSGTAVFDVRPDLVSTTSAGSQFIRENLHRIYAFGAGLTPGIETSLAGATSDFEAGELNTLNSTLSAYVQQQFAWRDKLFINGAVRADKNTAFGQNIGWISYPSFSGSWVVSDESFFPRIGFLNSLRLRSAYGKAGLRPGPTDALQAFGSQVTTVLSDAGDATDAAAITFNNIGNPALKPEKSTEIEFGFESEMLTNRLGLEVTYFTKTSKDALVQQPLPPSGGASATRFANLGEVNNRGLEYRVHGTALRSSNIEWNAGVTGSFIKNKLVSLGVDAQGKPIPDVTVSSYQRHAEGYPLGSYFHFPIISYADANGDGLLSPAEVVVRRDTNVFLGNPFPKREMSFSTDLRFRDWARLSTQIDYKGGHQLLNQTKSWRCSTADVGNCSELYDRNTPLDVQAAIVARTSYRSYAGFIENADFTKLREIALTLMVPQQYARRLSASNLSVTLAGRNLKTWTKYTGLDPELNYNGQSNFSTADFGTLPANRLFQIRVDAGF